MDATRKQFTIGIDPGVTTGFAVFDRRQKRIVRALSLDFSRTLVLIETEYPPDVCDVLVEDASLNKITFRRKAEEDYKITDRKARNVGAIQRESQLMIQELERRGYNVRAVRPVKSVGEPKGKWSADRVKSMTGYSCRSSQHVRDAIVICWDVFAVRAELTA